MDKSNYMHAMMLLNTGQPLQYLDIPQPQPDDNQLLIKISACGICRTDLHVVDGELKQPKLPLIPGHQIVGKIIALGKNVTNFKIGQRIGVPWLGKSCGQCDFCHSQRENLCDYAQFTGYQINGGFAEYCVADARFCFLIPDNYNDIEAAPLLCAGLIGYRAWRKTEKIKKLGLFGFGASAHIVIQIAIHHGQNVYAFTRPGDQSAQQLAQTLGAVWVGDSLQPSPELLDAAIIFAPDGNLVPIALNTINKGGILVCAGIHMSDIPSFPYEILWGEKTICSIANLTRNDGEAFLELAPKIPIRTDVHTYSLTDSNKALDDLRHGRFSGAAVITI